MDLRLKDETWCAQFFSLMCGFGFVFIAGAVSLVEVDQGRFLVASVFAIFPVLWALEVVVFLVDSTCLISDVHSKKMFGRIIFAFKEVSIFIILAIVLRLAIEMLCHPDWLAFIVGCFQSLMATGLFVVMVCGTVNNIYQWYKGRQDYYEKIARIQDWEEDDGAVCSLPSCAFFNNFPGLRPWP